MPKPAQGITIAAFICVVFFGSGCRTLGAPRTSLDTWTPPRWEKSSLAADPTWTSIRQHRFDFSKALSLAELVDIALSNNPATRQAWENARAAEAGRGQALSQWYPQVTGTADLTQTKKIANIKSNNVNQFALTPAGAFTFLLLDFGGRSANIRKTTELLLAANFQFNQAIQDLLFNVAKSYYDLYSAQSNLVAKKMDLENAKMALNAAEKRFEVGLVSKLDALQAKSSYYSSFYSLEDAKGAAKTAKASLANALGLPADTYYTISAPAKKMPVYITKEEVSQYIEEALKARPDVAALRADLRAKEAAVRAADSDLWPTVNFKGSVQKDWYRYFNARKEYGDDYQYSFFHVNGQWNVFDGFYNLNVKRQAEAEAEAARAELIQAEINASADVWTKYYGFKTAIQKQKFSKAFFTTAMASYDLAMQGYDAGLKSILDLLSAQSDLSDARSKLIQSQKDLFVAFVDMMRATGSLSTKEEKK